jgi:hypothetical protein
MSLVPLLVGLMDFLIGFIDPSTKHKITFPLFGPGKLDAYESRKNHPDQSPASEFSYPDPVSSNPNPEYDEQQVQEENVQYDQQQEQAAEYEEQYYEEQYVDAPEAKGNEDYEYYAQEENLEMPQFSNPMSLSSTGNTTAYIDVNNEADQNPNQAQ